MSGMSRRGAMPPPEASAPPTRPTEHDRSSSGSSSGRRSTRTDSGGLLPEILRVTERTSRVASDSALSLDALDASRTAIVDAANAALKALRPPTEALIAQAAESAAMARLSSVPSSRLERAQKKGRAAAAPTAPTVLADEIYNLAAELTKLAEYIPRVVGFMSRMTAMGSLPELTRLSVLLEVAIGRWTDREEASIRDRATSAVTAKDREIDDAERSAFVAIDGLASEWRSLNSRVESEHPAWSSTKWRDYRPPAQVSQAVRIGSIFFEHGPTIMDCPMLWAFPGGRSLLFSVSRPSATALPAAVLATVLRTIAGMPRGSVEVMFADPDGLGRNVAPIMHLRDYDSTIVHPQVLTDDADIERTLVDLTNHVTHVNSAFLKGKFSTIEEHNEAAGEVAVPYRLFVAIGYPSRFTEKAVARLGDLVETGGSAGVYAIVVVDSSAPLPYGATHDRLYASCVTVGPGSRLPYGDDGRHRESSVGSTTVKGLPADVDFRIDPPLDFRMGARPEDTVFGTIVDRLGAATRESRVRIVPFADLLKRFRGEVERNPALYSATPLSPVVADPGTWWKATTAAGIDVPLGQIGATQVQRFRLGGSANHAAVVGANGTGKSTLLHSLIGALCVTYGPDELELSLVDMKNGVGFKIYAGPPALPHARTVAVMCDRGVAVDILRSLVEEMRRRYDLFKELTARTGTAIESLASYRATMGAAMPRHVCVIDEFHDLTSADDALAIEANDLIRLLVKEARAAGIHLILATQNLVGCGLAKDALSEVAIRICFRVEDPMASEAALGDGNYSAVKDLPSAEAEQGVAIYNLDRSKAGNSIFKGSWIDRAAELPALVSGLARASVAKGRKDAPRIFDGDSPADILQDVELLAALGLTPDLFAPAPAPAVVATRSPAPATAPAGMRTRGSVAEGPTTAAARIPDEPVVRTSMGRRRAASPDAPIEPAAHGVPAPVVPAPVADAGPPPGIVVSSMGRGSTAQDRPAPGPAFGVPTVGADGALVLEGFVVEEEGADIDDPPAPGPGPALEPVPVPTRPVVARRGRSGATTPRRAAGFLGQPMRIASSMTAELSRTTGRNLLAVGGTEEAAVGMVTGCALGALATCREILDPAERLPLVSLLDFDVSDRVGSLLRNLAESADGLIDHVPSARAADRLADVAAEVRERERRRREGDALPHLLVLFGVQNAGMLRSPEYGEDASSTPAAAVRVILQHGPTVGVHVIAWADTRRAATRVFGTGDLDEFSLRVASGLSEADLQTVLDGSRLRFLPPKRAAFQDQTGAVSVFLPYAPLADARPIMRAVRDRMSRAR